jgi:hypothetical protein
MSFPETETQERRVDAHSTQTISDGEKIDNFPYYDIIVLHSIGYQLNSYYEI